MAVGLALAGCTAGVPLATTSPHTASSAPVETSTQGCVNATRLADASSGVIRAGEFAPNQGHWSQPGGTKFWVGSTNEAASMSGATIETVLIGSSHPAHVQHRPMGQQATVDTLPVFFPGVLRLDVPGLWRITVTIADDTGCFLIDAVTER